ncbi:hypothetical protein ANCDUO_06251 [Ancylostoma duodenale]|uniref:ET module n=1 Tax=Ancylostoma duodenale TaxID=51022 RepID=A0A0C2H236_9BILA|nr:hypothetical protein ANCDUO_06251 [Ancylostoma duodenale]
MSNSCATIEQGLSGCCCNDDACLTPKKSPATNPLMCYVGINAPKAGVNVGAEVLFVCNPLSLGLLLNPCRSQVPCNGMCSSLNAMVNGDNVTTFQCAPTSVCK